MTKGECCGTCAYHACDDFYDDWYCKNPQSWAYTDPTEYDYYCPDYERRYKNDRHE